MTSGNRAAQRRTIGAIMIMSILFLPGNWMTLWGEPKFRTFDQDRTRLDRYVEEAAKQETTASWERVLQGGKDALRAEWEQGADAEITRVLREEGETPERRAQLDTRRQEALAEWERQVDSSITMAEGQWVAVRENLVYEDFDRATLEEVLARAKNSPSLADWDGTVSPIRDEVTAQWERVLDERVTAARAKVTGLGPGVGDAYLAEIDRIKQELEGRFDVERNRLVFESRNGYISDLSLDTTSLRRESEQQSADAITQQIIDDTEKELEADEQAIVVQTDGDPDQAPAVDVSRLGDNWQAELTRIVERGLDRWREAQDKLSTAMLSWKATAEETYEAGEAKWRTAYDQLFTAKEAWRQKLGNDINAGINQWRQKEQDLRTNLDQAQTDFNAYTATLNERWNTHAQGLVEMATTGSKVYKDATDTVDWLTKMRDRYAGVPALNPTNGAFLTELNSSSDADMVALRNQVLGIMNARLQAGGNATVLTTIPADITIANNMQWTIFGPILTGRKWLTVETAFTNGNYNQGADQLTEQYRIVVKEHDTGYEMVDMTVYDGEGNPSTVSVQERYYRIQDAGLFSFNNVITQSSSPTRKSAYYVYQSELAKWQNIKSEFRGIVNDAEGTMHQEDMVGRGGPGYLMNTTNNYGLNAPGSDGDPYLMTDAEYQYRLASRDRDYWARRLDIAKAVLDYAYPATGRREDASATVTARDRATAAMTDSQSRYNEAVAAVNQTVAQLRVLQGTRPASPDDPAWAQYTQSIGYLTEQLDQARVSMEREREILLAIKRSVILQENGENVAFVETELRELELQYQRSEKDLRDTSATYYNSLREEERLARVNDFASLFSRTAVTREDARANLRAFDAVVSGSEDATKVLGWASDLTTQAAAIWGDRAGEVTMRLATLKKAYDEAAPGDRSARLDELAAAIRTERSILGATMTAQDSMLGMLENRSFDVSAYLSNNNAFDGPAYRDASALNRQALESVQTIMGSVSDKTASGVLAALRQALDAQHYTYGGDNSDYTVAFAAYHWAADHAEIFTSWDGATTRLAGETAAAREIASLYGSMDAANPAGFDTSSLIARADGGDAAARTALREYYYRGSAIAMGAYLAATDNHAGASDFVNARLRNFAAANRDRFAAMESVAANSSFADEVLTAINSAGGLTLTRDSLGTLSPAMMPAIADQIDAVIRARLAAGSPLPRSIQESAAMIRQAADALGESLFIQANRGANGDEIARQKSAANGVARQALAFMSEARQALLGNNADAGAISTLVADFGSLDGAARTYLTNLHNGDIDEMLVALDAARNVQVAQTARTLGQEFLGTAATTTVTDFMAARCAGMADADRQVVAAYLAGISEKKAMAGADLSAGLTEYLATRNLSGGTAADIRRYGLIAAYQTMLAGGAVDPAFREYADHKAADDPGYMSYLPAEVKLYVASNRYYTECYVPGALLGSEEAIGTYVDALSSQYALNDELKASLGDYLRDFRGIDRYYGQDLPAALGRLTAGAQADLRKYAYLTGPLRDTSLRGGFDTGAYGLDAMIQADLSVFGGMTAELMTDASSHLTGAHDAVGGDAVVRDREDRYARGLVTYQLDPTRFTSYRNYLINVPDTIAGGTATVLNSQENTGETTLDAINAGTGALATLYYAPKDADQSMLPSIILEGTNNFTRSLKLFLDTSGAETITHDPDRVVTIGEYLDQAHGAYDKTAAHAKTNGIYDFMSSLDTISSRVASSLALVRGRVTQSGDTLTAIRDAMGTQQSKIVDRGRTKELLKGADLVTLRANMDQQSARFHEQERVYEGIQNALTGLQDQYNIANTNYINQMSAIAQASRDLKAREYDYEKASAVWQYANTPYLKQEGAQDPGLTEGTVPGTTGNTVEDLAGISVPDAKEEYARIESIYNARQATFQTAEAAWRAQETTASLSADTAYQDRRDKLQAMTASYAHTAQAAVLLDEKLAVLRKAAQDAQAGYDMNKAMIFFNNQASAMTPELTKLRDQLMTRMLDNGRTSISAYIDSIANPWAAQQYTDDLGVIMTQFNSNSIDNLKVELAQLAYYGFVKNAWDLLQKFASLARLETMKNGMKRNLMNVYEARQTLTQKSADLNRDDGARDLANLKAVLAQDFGLTTEDLGHLYDDTTYDAAKVNGESVNIQSLRAERMRTDVDGRTVQAEREGNLIYTLDVNGRRVGTPFTLTEASIRLRDGGVLVANADAQEGKRYDFADYTYRISEVVGVMKERYAVKREEYRQSLEQYASDSVASGAHDQTVVLRDQEELYWGMLNEASAFGAGTGELRQRAFDGYQTIVREYVTSGRNDGSSVQDRIVANMIAQNKTFQQQEWQFTQTTFLEQERRWMETVGFIMNRGQREWADQAAAFENQWRRWRVDTRQAITDGEKAWQGNLAAFTEGMKQWQLDTSKATSQAAGEKLQEELADRIAGLLNNLNIPDKLKAEIDTDSILAKALKDRPVDSLGDLGSAMLGVNVTAGFADFLNLKLSPALSSRYALDMKDYTRNLAVMQNLRVVDVFHQMIDGFNTELAKQNKAAYDYVETDIRGNYAAPFVRDQGNRLWWLRVVSANSFISGRSYSLIPVYDYQDFATDAVKLVPLKGLTGAVDFTRPETIKGINADELDVYTRLESDTLSKQIESVMGQSGTFTSHRNLQFFAVGKSMDNAVEKFNAGVKLAGQAWYERQDFVMGNAIFQIVTGDILFSNAMKVVTGLNEGGAGGMALGVVSALASSAVQTLTVGNADFNMSWSYEDGFSTSMKAEAAYYCVRGGVSFGYSDKNGYNYDLHGGVMYNFGSGSVGLRGSIGFNQAEGWNGSLGASFMYQAGPVDLSLFAGAKYSYKNGWGVEASASISNNNFKVGVHAGWSEKEGFTGGVDVGLGKQGNGYAIEAGFDYNFTKKRMQSAYVNLNAGVSGGDGMSIGGGIGFSWNRDQGYGLSANSSMSMGADAIPGLEDQQMTMSMKNTLYLDKNGRYKGYDKRTVFDMQKRRERSEAGAASSATAVVAAGYAYAPGRKSMMDEMNDSIDEMADSGGIGGEASHTNEGSEAGGKAERTEAGARAVPMDDPSRPPQIYRDADGNPRAVHYNGYEEPLSKYNARMGQSAMLGERNTSAAETPKEYSTGQLIGQRFKNLFKGEGFSTNQQVFDKYLARDADYTAGIQATYIWQDKAQDLAQSEYNENNVILLKPGDEQYKDRKRYYDLMGEANGVDIQKELDGGKYVIMGDRGRGSHVTNRSDDNPHGRDAYHDRISVIYKNQESGAVEIQEFYRANLDPTSANAQNPIAGGVWDVMVGKHTPKINVMENGVAQERVVQREGLNVFDSNLIYKMKDGELKTELLNSFENNEITRDQIIGNKLTSYPDTKGGMQKWVNIHAGSVGPGDSKACSNIYGKRLRTTNDDLPGGGNYAGDFEKFMRIFQDNYGGRWQTYKLGKYIIGR